jgi:hypothetical protein
MRRVEMMEGDPTAASRITFSTLILFIDPAGNSRTAPDPERGSPAIPTLAAGGCNLIYG